MGGVLVQIKYDKVMIKRTVYAYGDFIALIGGFLKVTTLFFRVFVPMFKLWTLEKYLAR